MQISDSARLSYRMMTPEDWEFLFQLDQDPAVMKYINGGHPTSKEAIIQVYLPRMRSYTDPEKGWGLWKVSVKSTQQGIGWILVRPENFFFNTREEDNLELGWRFMASSWGQGLATEAAKTVMQALSKTGHVKKFSANAVEDNLASINIMKKLGMTFIKKGLHKDPLGDHEVVFYQASCGSTLP